MALEGQVSSSGSLRFVIMSRWKKSVFFSKTPFYIFLCLLIHVSAIWFHLVIHGSLVIPIPHRFERVKGLKNAHAHTMHSSAEVFVFQKKCICFPFLFYFASKLIHTVRKPHSRRHTHCNKTRIKYSPRHVNLEIYVSPGVDNIEWKHNVVVWHGWSAFMVLRPWDVSTY